MFTAANLEYQIHSSPLNGIYKIQQISVENAKSDPGVIKCALYPQESTLPNRTSIFSAVFAQRSRMTEKPRCGIISRSSQYLLQPMLPYNRNSNFIG